MADPDRPMVSPPLPAGGKPCPDCERPWSGSGVRHCQRAAPGSKCVVEGCNSRPLTECIGADGQRLAVICAKGGAHRWRKPA